MKRTSIRRALVPGIAVARPRRLTGCAGRQRDQQRHAAPQRQRAQRHAQRRRLQAQEAAQDAWRAGFQSANTASPSTTTRSARAPGARIHRRRRTPSPAPTPPRATTRASSTRPRSAAAATTRSRSRPTSARSRSSTTSRASTSCNSRAKTIAEIFDGKITNWNDPAIAGREPGRRRCPATDDHAGAPLGRLGHHGELHRLPRAGRRAAPGPTRPTSVWPIKGGEAAEGTSGVDRRRQRAARARSATPTTARPATSASPRSRSATSTSRRRAEGAAKVARRLAAGRGPRRRRHGDRRRPHHDRGGRLPAVLVSYLIACPTYDDAGEADLVKGFLSYVVSAPRASRPRPRQAGSAPLSSLARSEGRQASSTRSRPS